MAAELIANNTRKTLLFQKADQPNGRLKNPHRNFENDCNAGSFEPNTKTAKTIAATKRSDAPAWQTRASSAVLPGSGLPNNTHREPNTAVSNEPQEGTKFAKGRQLI
jgi:hypothetical protein